MTFELRYAGTEWRRKRPHGGFFHVISDGGLAVCGVGPLTGDAPSEDPGWRPWKGLRNRPQIDLCERCAAWLMARGKWPDVG